MIIIYSHGIYNIVWTLRKCWKSESNKAYDNKRSFPVIYVEIVLLQKVARKQCTAYATHGRKVQHTAYAIEVRVYLYHIVKNIVTKLPL